MNQFKLIITFILFICSSPINANTNARELCESINPDSFKSDIFQSDDSSEIGAKKNFIYTISEIYSKFASYDEITPLQELNDSEKGIYFTVDTGFYFNLDCTKPPTSNVLLEKVGIFPVGDLFKPLKKYLFSNGWYYFGMTRSGLLTFVHTRFLSKVENDKIYFFNKNHKSIQICTNGDNCSGRAKEFSGRKNFAIATTYDYDFLLKSRVNANNCLPINVDFFIGTKYKLNPKPEFKRNVATIEICNGISVVDGRYIHQEFIRKGITGNVIRFEKNRLKKILPMIITEKQCNEELNSEYSTAFTLGGGITGGFDIGVVSFNLEAGMEVNKTISLIQTFSNDNYYLFGTYSTKNNMGLFSKSKLMVNDFSIKSYCKNSDVPQEFVDFKIFLAPEKEYAFTININNLKSTAKQIRKDFETQIIATQGTYSKKQGKMWEVRGLRQYYLWKEVISGAINTQIEDLIVDGLGKNLSEDERYDLVEFYTSVVMAKIITFKN